MCAVTHSSGWYACHRWMSHVTQMNESCHIDEWVMSHRWMSHVVVMSHTRMRNVTHMNVYLPCRQGLQISARPLGVARMSMCVALNVCARCVVCVCVCVCHERMPTVSPTVWCTDLSKAFYSCFCGACRTHVCVLCVCVCVCVKNVHLPCRRGLRISAQHLLWGGYG